MKIQFQCKLLTDVVLNMKTATSGNQMTLDFIPGNCFLGIVASAFSQFTSKEKDLFFSGKVRFGDAHVTMPSALGLCRSLHIPASIMYPKLQSVNDVSIIHHFYKRGNDTKGTNGRPMQLKQSRNGYYIFNQNEAFEVKIGRGFAIKSAYDREKRRAADEQMYGYESLDKGAVFLFEVEMDDDQWASEIEKALTGKKRLGRSRTAQYGLVEITRTTFTQPKSRREGVMIDGKRYVTIYADGRLIFMNDSGFPIFRPTAEDLGIDGTICWEKSQVRTFQYAPYNYIRQTRDADRCGIEKGSVFVVETTSEAPVGNEYVGCFQNEGFGKVIYNPDFLEPSPLSTNGESKYRFIANRIESNPESVLKASARTESKLLKHLKSRKQETDANVYIYQEVNSFVFDNAKLFQDDSFASQWGNIRAIAMRCNTSGELMLELFEKYIIKHHFPTSNDPIEEDRKVNIAYLKHGIAKDKWAQGHRIDKLQAFIEKIAKQKNFNRDITIEAVVNLASEMAKKSKRS